MSFRPRTNTKNLKKEILELLKQGLSIKEVAEEIGVVESYVRRMKRESRVLK